MTNNAPVAVSSCSVSDLFTPAIAADLGPPIWYRTLQVTFSNTQDGVATKVTFDVLRDGTHSTVTERGHFSKGVPIEHFFDEYNGSGSQGPAVCTVAAVTFADGSTWTPRTACSGSGVPLPCNFKRRLRERGLIVYVTQPAPVTRPLLQAPRPDRRASGAS